KSRDIYKGPVIESSHVAGEYCAVYRIVGCAQKILWNMKAVGKIIGGAGRNIADGISPAPLHHAGHYFVNGAVSSAADYQVEIFHPIFPHLLICVVVGLRRIDHYFITGFYKNIYNI